MRTETMQRHVKSVQVLREKKNVRQKKVMEASNGKMVNMHQQFHAKAKKNLKEELLLFTYTHKHSEKCLYKKGNFKSERMRHLNAMRNVRNLKLLYGKTRERNKAIAGQERVYLYVSKCARVKHHNTFVWYTKCMKNEFK